MEKKISSYASNQGKLYFFNFSPWRMMQIESFFYAPNNQKFICKTLEEALQKGLDEVSNIFIYGIIAFPELEKFAKEKSMTVYRIEDAFIRSVALGSGFAKPYSLSIDSRGIYFDPSKTSDLEYLLENYEFSLELLERAKKVRTEVVSSKFSKYNHLYHQEISIDKEQYDKVILVIGQVEDDMSIKFGAYGLNNSDLLEMVKAKNPKAYIIYKPHPDVLSGNRVGHIAKKIIKRCANEVQSNTSIDSCIAVSDEVHTLTSGAGFDALLRGKAVFTYGMPFYAGWGLTTDYRKCERRTRILSLDALIATTLILFPRYISPKTGNFCEVEQTLKELKEEQERYFKNKFYRFKVNVKGYILPRGRKFIRAIFRPFKLKI
ncbi:MAG: Capsular polysaccharide export system protein KpsC [uncultured Sulfurovum sp.]|uniref:Capsular polysaccharide export system protein KpsC n=1 Tax=uncultured Sulfurovum sp. TaxID=269237 RepID=A0A6S6TS93_9BACT|nr:MAG: Capsular polysaccharide export system protein KpsC [uncultured Sulfurovum sp.]